MSATSKVVKIKTLMLDSGAFSAWRSGEPIAIKEYIKYVKRHRAVITQHVNLDVIPGSKGLYDASQRGLETAAAQSYANWQHMRDAGLDPIPVFHQGEDFKWLERMIDDGSTYVGISPASRAHRNEIVRWLDRVFVHITDRSGAPLIKTHGFGVTAPNLLLRYPWWSVDSTTWAVGAGFGVQQVPVWRGDRWDYTCSPDHFFLTNRDKGPKTPGRAMFDELGPEYQALIVRYYKEECGMSLSQVRNSVGNRFRSRIYYHLGLAEACSRFHFRHTNPPDLINSVSHAKRSSPYRESDWRLNLIFATPLVMLHSNALNHCKIQHRLLSYYHLMQAPDDVIEYYAEHGRPKPDPMRVPKQRWSNESYLMMRRIATIERNASLDEDGYE